MHKDRGSLISEGKRKKTKRKQVMHRKSLSTFHSQTDAWSVSEQCLPTRNPFLSVVIAEHNILRHGIFLWSVCVSCVPSQLLVHPRLLQGAEWEKEKVLMQHCSAIAKALVSCEFCCSPKSKTQHHMGVCKKS